MTCFALHRRILQLLAPLEEELRLGALKPEPAAVIRAGAGAGAGAGGQAEVEGGAGAGAGPGPSEKKRKRAAAAATATKEEEEDEEAHGTLGTPALAAAPAPPAGASKSRKTRAAAKKEEEPQPEPQPEPEDVGASREAAENDDDEDEDEDGPTEYEKRRLAIMKQNYERMMELELPGLAAELSAAKSKAAAAASQRGVTAKKQKKAEALPPRRSGRIQGAAPDAETAGGIDVVGGVLVKVAGEYIRVRSLPEPEAALDRTRPAGPLPLRSTNANEKTDAEFLRTLRTSGECGPLQRLPTSPKGGVGVVTLLRAKLTEDRVAKVTKNGVSHVAVHPRGDCLLIAAGDKDGQVGIWHPLHEAFRLPEKPGEEEEAMEAVAGAGPSEAIDFASDHGVLQFDLHSQYISGLKFLGTGLAAKLLSCAYDGTARLLDVEAGQFLEVFRDTELELSAMDATADARTAYLADKDGRINAVDLRTGALTGAWVEFHSKKVNTLSLEGLAEGLLAASSSDTSVSVWDVRGLGGAKAKPLHVIDGHAKSVQSAYFSPTGDRGLLTTSYDDTVKVWRPAASAEAQGKKATSKATSAGYEEASSVRHDNQTGRWVIPFRACWTSDGNGAVIGSMKRPIDLLDVRAPKGSVVGQMAGEGHQTAISSRHAVHPALPILVSATGSGRCHVYGV